MIPETAPSRGVSVRLRRWFAAPPQSVFRAWTDPAELGKWWCPEGWTPSIIRVDLKAGGGYSIGMGRPGGGPETQVSGQFIEVEAPRRLVYTWRWENAFEGLPETRVTVEFEPSGAGTQVVLIHEGFPEIGVCLRHREGWIAAWIRVAASLL